MEAERADEQAEAGVDVDRETGKTVECPGCEENCMGMPLYQYPEKRNGFEYFVACDRLDYMGFVHISAKQLARMESG